MKVAESIFGTVLILGTGTALSGPLAAQVEPDLDIQDADISHSPSGPAELGSSVELSADIHNLGRCYIVLADLQDEVRYDYSFSSGDVIKLRAEVRSAVSGQSAVADVRIGDVVAPIGLSTSSHPDWEFSECQGITVPLADKDAIRIRLDSGADLEMSEIEVYRMTGPTSWELLFVREAETYDGGGDDVDAIHPEPAQVDFYDGDPAASGVLIDSDTTVGDLYQKIESGYAWFLTDGAVATATATWTAAVPITVHDIHVDVPPVPRESSPSNNSALHQIEVVPHEVEIFGLDLDNLEFFTSNARDFVGEYEILGWVSNYIYATDFDAAGENLWGIDLYDNTYGTFDLDDGEFWPQGTIVGPTLITGLTAHADGQTWYASEYNQILDTSVLYVGDMTVGAFTLVGTICSGMISDISIDSQGSLYGYNLTEDALYAIDTFTGQGSFIGLSGQVAYQHQGMDFDWTEDALLTTIHTGGGTGVFANIDVATGFAHVLQDTTPLYAGMGMACRSADEPSEPGTAYCFGNTSHGNPCPCGNDNDGSDPDGAGCANGHFAAGAHLGASGEASLSNDTLVLLGTRGQPSNSSMFFQGINALDGAGVFLGDGLRCAGGYLKRLKVKLNDPTGAADTTPVVISQRSAQLGDQLVVGDVRYYQWWYRDSYGPCGNESNTSNGYMITWAP